MTPFRQFLILLLGSAFILLTIHFLLGRVIAFLKTRLSPQIVAFLSFFAGYLVIGVLAWYVYLNRLEGPELWRAFVYAFLVYSGFGYSYFHFFNMGETARRIKILCHLFFYGSIESEDMKIQFIPKEQIRQRLQRLLELGQITKSGERCFIRSRFFWSIAVVLMEFRKVLKL